MDIKYIDYCSGDVALITFTSGLIITTNLVGSKAIENKLYPYTKSPPNLRRSDRYRYNFPNVKK